MYRDLLKRALALQNLGRATASTSSDFLVGATGDAPTAPSPFTTAALRVDAELARLEGVLAGLDPGPGDESAAAEAAPVSARDAADRFLRVRRRVAARRVQAAVRKRTAASVGPPNGVLLAMRRGVPNGRGAVQRRRVHKSMDWIHGAVAAAYRFVLDVRQRALDKGAAPPAFGDAVYRHHLEAWGAGTLADRAAHDLYFNVRNACQTSKRCLLFAAFSGVPAAER